MTILVQLKFNDCEMKESMLLCRRTLPQTFSACGNLFPLFPTVAAGWLGSPSKTSVWSLDLEGSAFGKSPASRGQAAFKMEAFQ